MVSSPMYDRVMTFAAQADHTEELSAWDSEHRRVLRGFADAIDRVRHFQQHQGFTGQTGDALKAWADKTVARLESKRDYYMRGITHYVAARQAVAQAKADARQLSPTLLDAKTEALRSAATVSLPFAPVLAPVPGLVASAVLATGVAYVNAVEAQANAQREAAAAEILDRINAATGELGGGMGDLTQAGPNTDPLERQKVPPLPPSTKENLGRPTTRGSTVAAPPTTTGGSRCAPTSPCTRTATPIRTRRRRCAGARWPRTRWPGATFRRTQRVPTIGRSRIRRT